MNYIKTNVEQAAGEPVKQRLIFITWLGNLFIWMMLIPIMAPLLVPLLGFFITDRPFLNDYSVSILQLLAFETCIAIIVTSTGFSMLKGSRSARITWLVAFGIIGIVSLFYFNILKAIIAFVFVRVLYSKNLDGHFDSIHADDQQIHIPA